MGRLFWKFFLSIWLAQAIAVLAISGSIWIRDRNHATRLAQIELGPPAYFLLDAAEATLHAAGLSGLRDLLQRSHREQIYVVDARGQDLLGRPVDPATVLHARQMHGQNGYTRAIRMLTASDGSEWLVFAGRRRPPPDRPPPPGGMPPPFGEMPPPGAPLPPPPPRPGTHFPVMQMSLAMLASLASAGILAWYFARPIRHLRSAFDAVAAGKLDTRIGAAIGGRRDDLANLAHDFDRMAAQLQVLVDGQRRLLHDVSHELRSPLARLQAAIGLARQRPEKSGAWLERIERESERMDKLIGELLTLSRLETGVANGPAEDLNIGELVADIVDDARFEARAEGKEVLLQDDCLAFVRGRPELLQSAIENVIRNAVRHTPPGLPVEVSVRQHAPGNAVGISVRDHGPGVPAKELEAIFEPFVQGSGNAVQSKGFGLGLAIAQRVVHGHGGTIVAANAEGGGLRVDIVLLVVAA
ncbi:MAG TPA: ATP-binding protein [Noviherbaspirillum sp.]|nr:ATP-binding protein [Noviherbaspirillum sp.]